MTSVGVLQIAIFFGADPGVREAVGSVYGAGVRRPAYLHASGSAMAGSAHLQDDRHSEEVEQRWTHYTASLLSFSIFGFLLTYLLQRAQGFLPFNPAAFRREPMFRPTWRSIPRPASSPIPTGRRTPANRH